MKPVFVIYPTGPTVYSPLGAHSRPCQGSPGLRSVEPNHEGIVRNLIYESPPAEDAISSTRLNSCRSSIDSIRKKPLLRQSMFNSRLGCGIRRHSSAYLDYVRQCQSVRCEQEIDTSSTEDLLYKLAQTSLPYVVFMRSNLDGRNFRMILDLTCSLSCSYFRVYNSIYNQLLCQREISQSESLVTV